MYNPFTILGELNVITYVETAPIFYLKALQEIVENSI